MDETIPNTVGLAPAHPPAFGSFGNRPGIWIRWEHAKKFAAAFFMVVISETSAVSMEYTYIHMYIYIWRSLTGACITFYEQVVRVLFHEGT